MQEELKLDPSLQDSAERIALVQRILDARPPDKINNNYLQILANYIIGAKTIEERHKKNAIITDNRKIILNKRQTSFEGLASKFENGEDGIYGMMVNDKNILLTPKIEITQQEIDTIPQLAELVEEIHKVEEQHKKAVGKKRFLLKKQLIQMRQSQYIIKMAYKPPITCMNIVSNSHTISFDDQISIINGEIHDTSLISLFNPSHISALLRNYSRLKEDCYGKFYTDGYYLMEDLDNLINTTIKEKYPLYFKLLIYKIDGKSNAEIQQLLEEEFQIKHSQEYISCLWRQKIPKLLAEAEKKKYLIWYYTVKQKGAWKKCNKCGEIKLAHNLFFSKNSSGKDGFYSICKECRNKVKDKNNLIIKFIPYQRKEAKDVKEDMR